MQQHTIFGDTAAPKVTDISGKIRFIRQKYQPHTSEELCELVCHACFPEPVLISAELIANIKTIEREARREMNTKQPATECNPYQP